MIEKFETSIQQHGFIGDTTLPKLVYLTLISALFDTPVSLLIKGPASAGKSYALACAKRYVPEDGYEQFEAMSERALAYLGAQLDLRHKTLILQEAAGMAGGAGRVFLRQLLTEGQIRYATVQSTRDGLQGVELPVVEGPCGLIMTTTANRIHHEDETRMLTFHIDEGSEHIRAILEGMANGLRTSEPSEDELKAFHQLYEELRETTPEVSVPFQSEIAQGLPLSHPRILRDFPKVITLVKALALLHSNERERDNSGTVIATKADYETVRQLIDNSLAYGLEIAIPEGLRRVVEAVGEMEAQSTVPDMSCFRASQREIAAYMGLDPSVVSREVHRAVEMELLRDENPGQGRHAELRVGSQPLPTSSVLPVLSSS